MTEIVGIKFKSAGKCYYFDPAGLTIEKGSHVIVETSQGIECGTCDIPNSFIEESEFELKKVIRVATDDDEKRIEERAKKQETAFNVCLDMIEHYNLPMKLVETECAFDGGKMLFYFTADGRIDFRELVKDLASVFHTRIEMRQVGARDEARMLGGIGICGKEFCCSSFLNEFQPVSIKMAKEQNLSLNPTKISGVCGRLMCCLKYEQDTYEYLHKITPRVGALVETPNGKGVVESVDLIAGQLKVRIEDKNDTVCEVFSRNDVKLLAAKAPNKANNDVDYDELVEDFS